MGKKEVVGGLIFLSLVFIAGVISRFDLRPTLKPLSTQFQPKFRKIYVPRFPKVKSVNCPLIWKGDKNETARALRIQAKFPRQTLPGWRARNLTWNCDRFLQDGGFNLSDVSKEELSFPLAFSLLVYRDVDQVERLLRAVYRPHNVYCIHVDLKAPPGLRHGLGLMASCLTNVFISDIAEDVKWGKFTNLHPELLCMRQLWAHGVKWKYFINLTGQEFPLKTNKEIVRILQSMRGANAIDGDSSRNTDRWKSFLPAPYNLTIYKGGVHIAASRDYVHYALHSHVGRALLEWLRPTRHPDESFFNTLNHNTKLGVPGSYNVNHTRASVNCDWLNRYKLWWYKGAQCAGRYVRAICVLGVGDLPRLTTSRSLFANKLRYSYQPLTYDCLEEWYFHKVRLEQEGAPPPLNISIYANHTCVQNAYRGKVKIW